MTFAPERELVEMGWEFVLTVAGPMLWPPALWLFPLPPLPVLPSRAVIEETKP